MSKRENLLGDIDDIEQYIVYIKDELFNELDNRTVYIIKDAIDSIRGSLNTIESGIDDL